jgi:hypothetical protein
VVVREWQPPKSIADRNVKPNSPGIAQVWILASIGWSYIKNTAWQFRWQRCAMPTVEDITVV